MTKLTVLILTYNEEKNIKECIESASFADEILIIDSGSTDRTREIAESLGARVVVRPMPDGFAAQRNFALTQTDSDWVMFLDADERITPELANEIKATVEKNEPYAFDILRLNHVFGKLMRYGGFRPDWSLRLYPRSAISWTGLVHEQAHVNCPKRRLNNPMKHYTYDDWDRYFDKFNRYTSIMARKLFEEGKRVGLAAALFRSGWGFFRAYILQSGWRDGRLGFIFSLIHFYYTFIKYIKLEEIHRRTKK